MLSTESKIRLATLLQRPVIAMRRAAGLPPTLRARRNGITWELDLREGVDFSIWLLGAYELRTVFAYSRLLRPGFVVFDIGANIGAHTLPLAMRVGEGGRVHAFEPVQWAIQKLRDNLNLNPELCGRVEVRQLLLGDNHSASVPPALHASWPLVAGENIHPTLRARLLPTTGAEAMTLDAYVAAAGISRVDFIKIDVDGSECRVLRGARQTLRRHRPAIIVELSPCILEEAGESLDALLDIFDEAGYQLTNLLPGMPLPKDRKALHRSIPDRGGINALALPSGRS